MGSTNKSKREPHINRLAATLAQDSLGRSAYPPFLRDALAADLRALRLASARRWLAVVPRNASGFADAARLPRRGVSDFSAAVSDLKLVPLTKRNSMRRASRTTRATCTCTASVSRYRIPVRSPRSSCDASLYWK